MKWLISFFNIVTAPFRAFGRLFKRSRPEPDAMPTSDSTHTGVTANHTDERENERRAAAAARTDHVSAYLVDDDSLCESVSDQSTTESCYTDYSDVEDETDEDIFGDSSSPAVPKLTLSSVAASSDSNNTGDDFTTVDEQYFRTEDGITLKTLLRHPENYDEKATGRFIKCVIDQTDEKIGILEKKFDRINRMRQHLEKVSKKLTSTMKSLFGKKKPTPEAKAAIMVLNAKKMSSTLPAPLGISDPQAAREATIANAVRTTATIDSTLQELEQHSFFSKKSKESYTPKTALHSLVVESIEISHEAEVIMHQYSQTLDLLSSNRRIPISEVDKQQIENRTMAVMNVQNFVQMRRGENKLQELRIAKSPRRAKTLRLRCEDEDVTLFGMLIRSPERIAEELEVRNNTDADRLLYYQKELSGHINGQVSSTQNRPKYWSTWSQEARKETTSAARPNVPAATRFTKTSS